MFEAAAFVYDHTSVYVFDYSRRRDVLHNEIVLPTEAARSDTQWARDREVLWNAAEVAKNRSNSRVARAYEFALPHELSANKRECVVHDFSPQIADRYIVAVDDEIHVPHWHDDPLNSHVHIRTTARLIGPGNLRDKRKFKWLDTDRRKAASGRSKPTLRQSGSNGKVLRTTVVKP